MYITQGSLQSLLKWFQKSDYSIKFLCLLVAGHLNDSKFFSDIFEHQETLNTISGESIAIFLFANDTKGMLTIETSGGVGERLLGDIVLPHKHIEGLWYEHISNIDKAQAREKVVKATQNIANDICLHFRLDVDDIPCILFISRFDSRPYVIPTRGEADVKDFYKFLKEARRIAETLPKSYDSDTSIWEAKKLVAEEEEAKAKTSLAQAEAELKLSLDQMLVILERHGMPHTDGEKLFNPQTAEKTWEIIGLRQDLPQPPEARNYSSVFKKALAEDSLKGKARDVLRTARDFTKAQKRHQASEKRISQLESLWTKINYPTERYTSAKTAIDNLCNKFDKKFVWKSRYRPVRDFIEALLGVSRKTNELLSLQETIKKLITCLSG